MTISPARAFADAAAAMVTSADAADVLANLLRDCAELTSAAALGLLVRNGAGDLELLSATSHQTAELELYQLQHDDGPCLEAVRTGSAASAGTPADMATRWGAVGEAISAAGYQSVYAAPLRWHGETIGALNAFRGVAAPATAEEALLLQAFADVASIAIVQATGLSLPQLARRIDTALAGRTVIEQAKGVLAYLDDVDPAAAYQLLRDRAEHDRLTLTEAATRIVDTAARR